MKKTIFGVSLLTISCLYGMLAGLIILLFLVFGGDILIAVIVSLIVLLLQFLLAPFFTDLSMKWFYKADFKKEIPSYLNSFINEMCEKYKIKYPKIGIIDDGGPNAFTYGRTKKDARIIITRGLTELLSEEEVKAVISHEIGHIVHYDMLFMTVLQVIPLVLYAIYEMFVLNNKDSDDDKSAGAIIGLIAYILYIISQYIILYLSRLREYYADSFAIQETKKPTSLADALVKIGFGLSTAPKNGKHDVSKNNALGIFDTNTSKSLVVTCYDNEGISKDNIKNAMKWELWNPWAKWYEINSTHPLISKRLLKISGRCHEYNEQEYIKFDLEKEESYVDDFIIEVLLKILPIIILISTLIVVILVKNNELLVVGLGGVLFVILLFILHFRTHKNKDYKKSNVSNLLGEVKVSGVTCIPCELEGNIIGRGNPGCIFNEDFILKDESGIIFLDYNQPLFIINKIFALFKSKEYFDKTVSVKGWYRRSPVPYVEIKEMIIDGKTKKIKTFIIARVFYIILLLIFLSLILFNFI